MAEIVQQVQQDHAQNDDVESANTAWSLKESKDSHTEKRLRRLAYVTALVLFLTVFVFVVSLTFIRIQNRRFLIRTINIEHLVVRNDKNVPSLDMKFDAEVCVKNTHNFGHFEFDEGSISFFYRDAEVGEASIVEEKVGARSSKAMNVRARVEINGEDSSFESSVKSGLLTLASQAKLSGKVRLMKVIKQEKTAVMNCTIVIHLAKKVVHDLNCK